MTLNLQSFLNEMFAYENVNIRIVGTSDNPWFCGKDVCDVLGYTFYRDALKTHVDADCKCSLKTLLDSSTEVRYTEGLACYINERGLHSLIVSSRLPSSKHFRNWIVNTLIPSLRTMTTEINRALTNKELELNCRQHELAKATKELQEERQRNNALKVMVSNFKLREIDQYLYIATTKRYANQNLFKVGGVKSHGLLKSRLATYNTGRPTDDKMFYCATFKCVNFRHLEKRIEDMIDGYKDARRAEMYIMKYEDLLNTVTAIAASYERDVSTYGDKHKDIVTNLVSTKPTIPNAIDV